MSITGWATLLLVEAEEQHQTPRLLSPSLDLALNYQKHKGKK